MERIFRFDEINAEKQKNVKDAYPKKDIGEIVLVIDDTAFRGCRDGLILTEHFIATKKMFQEPDYYLLDLIKSVECIDKNLILNGMVVYQFTLVEQDELDIFVEFLNDLLQEEVGRENNNSGSVKQDEETDTVEITSQGLIDFIELQKDLHRMWTDLIVKISDDEDRSKIIAQRTFVMKIMKLCAGWHTVLSCEAKTISNEENLFQYDLSCYLSTLTYVAAYIDHLLTKEAGYKYENRVRYVQFPFAIMKCIGKKYEEKGSSISVKAAIAAAAGKNEITKEILALEECINSYDNFRNFLKKDLFFSDYYIIFSANIPFDASQNKDEDERMFFYTIMNKVSDLKNSNNFVEFVEKGLTMIEKEIEVALLEILQKYGPYNKFPHDLGFFKPSSVSLSINTDGMRKRVRVSEN